MTRTGDVARGLAAATADLRNGLAELAELDRYAPDEVAAVVGSLVAHLRSSRPESVSPLGILPPPTEAIRDPRGVQ